ncbi:AbrB family transcriptional regulator [Pacificibacter sp. AS14]|uniref:AbrB family transcriptional regulator n=1 Tax=Pacificibacter sp. AS14 TaxID=3135785 RepID=UPI00316BB896
MKFNLTLPLKSPQIALALAIGTGGGLAFSLLGLPLPWMLGAMFASFLAVIVKVPLQGPGGLRPYVMPVIGIMLGAGFDTQTFSHLQEWAFSLIGLVIYIAVAAALVVPLYIKIGRLDPVTAFFSAMPGGLNEMTIIGGELGGDEKRIILSHAARIVVTVSFIAVYFRLVLGYNVASAAVPSGTQVAFDFKSGAILLSCAVLGWVLGKALKLPAAPLLGPLILSAIAHMTGISHSAPPPVLVICSQIILGTMMGCRFMGAPSKLIVETLVLSAIATTVMLAVSLGFAVSLHSMFGQTTQQVLLAYAPGGLTEMSLVAIAMNGDVAYIALHHLARIVILIAIAPSILSWLAIRLRR